MTKKRLLCSGKTYSGTTKQGTPPSKGFYGNQTAVCDGCTQRVQLNGNRLPTHYLDVTIHGVAWTAQPTLQQLFPGI